MNIEVNLDNLTAEEKEQFNALVEKANKLKSEVWMPEKNKDSYYFLTSDKEIYIDSLRFEGDDFDESNYAIGNCFKTREYAEFALEKLKVIAEMKRYIAEHDDTGVDWNNTLQEKWHIRYHRDTDIMDIDYSIRNQIVDNSFYASSRKILENMIKEVGEDRIKKYYFGVE